MIPVFQALKIVREITKPLAAESVSLADALGRFLAEDIVADSDLPPFDRSQMDGYALRAEDLQTVPRVCALLASPLRVAAGMTS